MSRSVWVADSISENVEHLAARSLEFSPSSGRSVCLGGVKRLLTHLRAHSISNNDNPVFEQCQLE